MRAASIALPISLSRSSRAALIPSIRDPFTTPISIGAPFPIDKVHCHSSMPPWGLTEIFRSKGSYFDCILQICPFGEPDQPQICAFFKLTHYRRLSWRPLSFPVGRPAAAAGIIILKRQKSGGRSSLGGYRVYLLGFPRCKRSIISIPMGQTINSVVCHMLKALYSAAVWGCPCLPQ